MGRQGSASAGQQVWVTLTQVAFPSGVTGNGQWPFLLNPSVWCTTKTHLFFRPVLPLQLTLLPRSNTEPSTYPFKPVEATQEVPLEWFQSQTSYIIDAIREVNGTRPEGRSNWERWQGLDINCTRQRHLWEAVTLKFGGNSALSRASCTPVRRCNLSFTLTSCKLRRALLGLPRASARPAGLRRTGWRRQCGCTWLRAALLTSRPHSQPQVASTELTTSLCLWILVWKWKQ